MKYRYISDSHTHSRCSFDGTDSVAMMTERAVNLGLYSITVTDHCECHEYFEKGFNTDIINSITEISRSRAVYNDKIKVYTGIELGQPTQNYEAAMDALNLAEFDFVLGSLHNLKNEQDFYFLNYTPVNAPVLLRRYFNELLELAKQNLFDSLAHMDYPMRYILGNSNLNIDIRQFAEQIDEILKILIKNNKALEINTSGLRQVIGRTLPDERILKRFKELGGKYVTLGSDAHRWGDIGSGIEQGLDLLSACGFSHFTIYEKREPQLLPVL